MIKESEYPRVSIVNCVSEALEMLKFSSEQLIENAGTDNFDYIIVCWNTTPEVDFYIEELEREYKLSYPKLKVFRVEHKEIPQIGYVPNLRAMINEGYKLGFKLNDYSGLVNTDMAFYKNWLINLVKYCGLIKIVGAVTIMPKKRLRYYYQADFGATEYGKFNNKEFIKFCEQKIKVGGIITESQLAKGENALDLIAFPNLFSRQMWYEVGPWELTLKNGTPDVNFFQKAIRHGFKVIMSLDSITYHLEGAERGKFDKIAPKFSKKMDYDPISFYSRVKRKFKKEFFNLLKKVGIIKKENKI